jgi:hypothetical protein
MPLHLYYTKLFMRLVVYDTYQQGAGKATVPLRLKPVRHCLGSQYLRMSR